MTVWMAVEWLHRRKPSGIGVATGAVAGLAAITPAAGYVPAWAALVIGALAGVICYGAVQLKYRLRYDDALDVVGVHMVAGVIGVLLTGVFASLAVNAAGVDAGLVQFGRQAVLAVTGLAYPFIVTMIILWLVDKVVGLRVAPDEEVLGLDLGEYGETGYMLDLFSGSPIQPGTDGADRRNGGTGTVENAHAPRPPATGAAPAGEGKAS
jgi:Amt family ammonium transporter